MLFPEQEQIRIMPANKMKRLGPIMAIPWPFFGHSWAGSVSNVGVFMANSGGQKTEISFFAYIYNLSKGSGVKLDIHSV